MEINSIMIVIYHIDKIAFIFNSVLYKHFFNMKANGIWNLEIYNNLEYIILKRSISLIDITLSGDDSNFNVML